MKCPVLYEDRDVLAVAKPAGVVVIPARNEDASTSLRRLLEASRGEALWVVHRIDRDTSGVVLFARTAEAHRALSVAFERRDVEKTYLALTRGALSPSEGSIDYALHAARKGKMRPAHKGEPESLDAHTRYRVRTTWPTRSGTVSLVELSPRTGRQHQLRVHLRAKEAPLLVDPLYGRAERVTARELGFDHDATLDRLSLHAASLDVPRPSGEGRLKIDAPLADDLSAMIAAFGG
jgi:tRNA pseudouridine32 synthase / 23S rRNA pseudouridine746 synthase